MGRTISVCLVNTTAPVTSAEGHTAVANNSFTKADWDALELAMKNAIGAAAPVHYFTNPPITNLWPTPPPQPRNVQQSFVNHTAPIGQTMKIRRPMSFVPYSGPTSTALMAAELGVNFCRTVASYCRDRGVSICTAWNLQGNHFAQRVGSADEPGIVSVSILAARSQEIHEAADYIAGVIAQRSRHGSVVWLVGARTGSFSDRVADIESGVSFLLAREVDGSHQIRIHYAVRRPFSVEDWNATSAITLHQQYVPV